MNKTLLIALIDSLISEKLESSKVKGPRGPRGLRGKEGQFDWEENEDNIKSIIQDYIASVQKDLKLSFDDLSKEDIQNLMGPQGEKGPRGQRGKSGKDFDFEEYKEKLTDILFNFYNDSKSEFKLNFSDLTEEEKDQLKLKFNHLSEEDVLKLQGPQGERGSRGQRGKSGKDFDFEENEERISSILSSSIEEKKESLKLKFSDLSGSEVKSLQGPRGLPGLTGIKGESGQVGKDGKEITDIRVVQEQEEFYLVFDFNDLTSIRTDKIQLPNITRFVQQVMMIGGSGASTLVIEKDGLEVGEAETINFVGDNIDVTYDSLNKKVDIEVSDNDVPDCIEVKDEGSQVTDCVKSFDFIGDNVEVLTQTVLGDWVSLSEVDPLTQEVANPGHVRVQITDRDFAKFLLDEGVCDEPIEIGELVTVIDDTTNRIALGQFDDPDKAWVEGFAIESGLTNETIQYVLFGKVDVTGNIIPRNSPAFLASNGLITGTAPLTGYVSVIGKSRGANSIFLNPSEPIYTGVP